VSVSGLARVLHYAAYNVVGSHPTDTHTGNRRANRHGHQKRSTILLGTTSQAHNSLAHSRPGTTAVAGNRPPTHGNTMSTITITTS
jgi:hypothetical protein